VRPWATSTATSRSPGVKAEDGGDLLIYGSSTFADVLTEASLIDEYRVMVFPVVVGAGARLFSGATIERLHLRNVVTTTTGVALLTYVRDDHTKE
jgi:dihydrofolate reductase